MSLRMFFHKIKMIFVRAGEPRIENIIDEKKQYGIYGEVEFMRMFYGKLPDCKMKMNVVISTLEGNAEIDCLVLYKNKLFAIEVKRLKGDITEQDGRIVKTTVDRWTGETHIESLKSPFKQLNRAVYLLKKQIPIKAWINTVVFFVEDAPDESVEGLWFDKYDDLAEYICNEGNTSFGKSASDFFERVKPADCLYSKYGNNYLKCVINPSSLLFEFSDGVITSEHIDSISIVHHWSYDELHIELINGLEKVVEAENAKIQVFDNGRIGMYALCNLDFIEIGRAI